MRFGFEETLHAFAIILNCGYYIAAIAKINQAVAFEDYESLPSLSFYMSIK